MSEELKNCPHCSVGPGAFHLDGCHVERCSSCGGERVSCGCGGEHDPLFARWTGIFPGKAEGRLLGLSVDDFYGRGLHRILFVKPTGKA